MNPGSSALATSVLALGIGVNAAVFSVLKDVWLDRLPVARPQELVQVILEGKDARMSNLPYPEAIKWLLGVRGFDGVLFYRDAPVNFRDGDTTERVRARFASGDYFATLGVEAATGRVLLPTDDRPSSLPVAVISHEFWARRFGSDPAAVGRVVYASGRSLAIVGVTPASYFGVDRLWVPEITLPLASAPAQVQAIARLKPGIALQQAQAEVSGRLLRLLETEGLETASWPTRGRPLGARLDRAAAGAWGARLLLLGPLRALSTLALLMLLMTCLSVAGLVHARASARTREFGVRLALGADRGRVVRQVLLEGIALGSSGGLVGILVAFGLHQLLVSLLPVETGAALGFRVDGWMLGFNTLVSVASGIVFGLGPALRASRLAPHAALKGASAAGRRGRLRGALAFQVAASLVLSVAAASFVRSLGALFSVDAGFDRSHTLLVTLDPEECQLSPQGLVTLTEELGVRVRALPGVSAAGFGLQEVSAMRGWAKTMWVEGRDDAPDEGRLLNVAVIGPGFLAATGMPLLSGRDVGNQDVPGTPPVALINKALADRYFPHERPLGRRLGDGPRPAPGRLSYEIVGVVGDARHGGLRRSPQPTVFHALAQASLVRPFVLHVRTPGRPGALVASLRQAIRATDPRLVVASMRTVAEQTAAELRQERLFAALATLFAILGLCLCSVALYGITAECAERRTREIGVRVALGAGRPGIVALMLRETLTTVVVGLGIGCLAARLCEPITRGLVYGVAPFGFDSIAIAATALTTAAIAAALVPARRASRIDPAVAMRAD